MKRMEASLWLGGFAEICFSRRSKAIKKSVSFMLFSYRHQSRPRRSKGFFKNQAQTHIAHALELLAELQRPVTLSGALDVLSSKPKLDEELEFLNKFSLQTPRRYALNYHFKNRFLDQPAEQLGGVHETVGNYLPYFLTPEVAEIFYVWESTFDISEIDKGKIILVTMPQKFQTGLNLD